MDTEFIFWRHDTTPGIKVEEISGGALRRQTLWLQMARQLFGEYGKERFREILHLDSGAPILDNSDCRISVTHTDHFMAVAFLPPTPECRLTNYNSRTALGIDSEHRLRRQVLKVIRRVASDSELKLAASEAGIEFEKILGLLDSDSDQVPESFLVRAVLIWTIKEAAFKAALSKGIDFIHDIKIHSLPSISPHPLSKKSKVGDVSVYVGEEREERRFNLFSYLSEENVVTLAYSPQSAKYGTKL